MISFPGQSTLKRILTLLQVWIFVELVFVYFFYIETRGPTLEEVTKIFDGKNAEVSHVEDIHQV